MARFVAVTEGFGIQSMRGGLLRVRYQGSGEVVGSVLRQLFYLMEKLGDVKVRYVIPAAIVDNKPRVIEVVKRDMWVKDVDGATHEEHYVVNIQAPSNYHNYVVSMLVTPRKIVTTVYRDGRKVLEAENLVPLEALEALILLTGTVGRALDKFLGVAEVAVQKEQEEQQSETPQPVTI